MLDKEHDKIDFPFEINGKPFNQLYYLVDGIYPSLTGTLPSINNPTIKLNIWFTPKKEGFRTSLEKAFGV